MSGRCTSRKRRSASHFLLGSDRRTDACAWQSFAHALGNLWLCAGGRGDLCGRTKKDNVQRGGNGEDDQREADDQKNAFKILGHTYEKRN